MDDFELPDDLKDTVEVVYLDDDEYFEEASEEEMGDLPDEELQEQVVDLAKLTFVKHGKSVFCCDLSQDGSLAITGGEDDMAYVWSTQTGDVVLECTGHKDSVTEVAFNHNSQYVATGDMGGLIQVWSLKDKKLVWCYEGDDLEWLTWHHMVNVLVAGTQTGDIYIWQIPQGNCKVLASVGTPSTCGKILPDGKRLAAGYSDGQVKLWDMTSANSIWQTTEMPMGINSIDVSSDGSLIASAPLAQLLKSADGRPAGTLLFPGNNELEAVVFNTELNVLVTGALTGQLCVWDIGRQTLRHQAKIECPVTVFDWAQKFKLIVGATDGAVYVCDVRTGTLSETLTGHLTDILSVAVSKDGTFVLTTSDDGTAKIFNIKSD